MSSGVPSSILAASSVNQSVPFANPFSHFGYLFSGSGGGGGGNQPSQTFQQHSLPAPTTPNNRFKVKRHRQRVDAGEPRNTYQGVTNHKSKHNNSTESNMMQIEPSINSIWAVNQEASEGLKSAEESGNVDGENIGTSEDRNSEGCKSEEVTTIEPQQEATISDDVDFDEEVNNGDDIEREESIEKEETPTSRESPSSTSSASKRKSFMPQKIKEQLGIDLSDEPEKVNISVGADNEDDQEIEEKPEQKTPSIGFSALQAQLSNSTAAHTIFETQKKLYAAFIEQQRKIAQQNLEKNQEKKINYELLMQMLRSEIFDNLPGSIEKIVKNWAVTEVARQETLLSAAAAAASTISASSSSSSSNGTSAITPQFPPHPPFSHPIFPHNPLAAFQLHNSHPIGSSIFPTTINPFGNLQAINALRRNLEDDGPKKKRVKVWEPKLKEEETRTGTPLSNPSSPPLAGSSTPNLNRYFPPTMVGHPLYGGVSFGQQPQSNHHLMNDREDSPTNSDEMSDCGGYEGGGANSTLTPMHLRKAKLMFFYTRYPNSNLLKSYFPDIRFNKNNTAQLVKWFSNFREFYYIQMEKFGRQLLAEGVQSREEIIVTKDCELFKALNTHYNRNNHIKAPDRLVYVVQETLREFFDAIRLGKDVEPSWKKTIYKIINRMDDPIPDFFKEPNFLEKLET